MIQTTKKSSKLSMTRNLIYVALLAALTVGCGKPTFDTMAPSKLKSSIAVVAQPDSDAQKASVEQIMNNLAMQHAVVGQLDWVNPGAGAPVLQKIAQQGGTDLVLLTADSANVQAIAKKYPDMHFVVVGDTQTPSLNNVRNITIDRKRLLFLSGFLAAEANRESTEPFSVLVDHIRPADDPDWQMILAGVKLAGRHDVPVQVLTSSLSPQPHTQPQTQTKQASSTTTGSTFSDKKPPLVVSSPPKSVQFSGRSILLLDNLTADAATKIHAQGLKVIRTDQSSVPLSLQANVVAQPTSILDVALQEEADQLTSGKWGGKQVVSIDGKQTYKLLQPGLITDKDISARLDIIEAQLADGSLKPETYLAQ